MENEIVSFALDIAVATSPLGVKDLTKQFDYRAVAECLINAGYRKADEVRKETAKEILLNLRKEISCVYGEYALDVVDDYIRSYGVEVDE